MRPAPEMTNMIINKMEFRGRVFVENGILGSGGIIGPDGKTVSHSEPSSPSNNAMIFHEDVILKNTVFGNTKRMVFKKEIELKMDSQK